MVGIGQRQTGFTLIEMMVVIAIISIMASIAYPSMKAQIAQNQLKDAVNTIETSLKQARADALVTRANLNVKMDTSANTLSITPQKADKSEDTTKTQTKRLNSNITVEAVNSMPAEMVFTPTKQVFKKSDSTPLTSGMGYSFCVKGISTAKYVITLDALSNIQVTQSGACS